MKDQTGSKKLTFELSPAGGQLEIHCNRQGLDALMHILTKLQAAKSLPQHDHLMTPSWSGHELTEEPSSPEATLLNMVTIRLLPD